MQVLATIEGADSGAMGDTQRAAALKARRLALGIKSVRDLATRSGVSREAITAAEDGKASEGTYARLEAWLTRFEEETGHDSTGAGQVTFRLSGPSGVDIVVQGPVDSVDELEAAVERLIRRLGDDSSGESK